MCVLCEHYTRGELQGSGKQIHINRRNLYLLSCAREQKSSLTALLKPNYFEQPKFLSI